MRLVLFADGYVGNEIASFLIKNFPKDLSMVVCIAKNNIYHYAKSKNIKVCDYGEEKTVLNEISCDLGVLAWWPKLIKEPLLSMPKNGYINTHPSLLPYNRGKHYNFWALVEQAPFGVTLHFIDSGIDTGAIIFQTSIDYDWCDTGETLYKKAQAEMIKLFIENYHLIRIGNYKKKPQDIKSGSYHHSSELNEICEIKLDEKYQARHFLNLLRARTFTGYPSCFFTENGSSYEISLTIKKVNK
jgi:methionyl-tRNA formyltransferase